MARRYDLGSDITLPAIIIGAWLLLREAKGAIPTVPIPVIGYSGAEVDTMLTERTEALQVYEAERVTAAQDIEAKRAVTATATGNYGTVIGSLGGFTGSWFGNPTDPTKCHLLRATSQGSGASKFFTGSYCLNARAQGLID